MIRVTRFDGTVLMVNAELIEFVEATPDTMLTMTTGHKIVVRETPDMVLRRILAYKQAIVRGPNPLEEGD